MATQQINGDPVTVNSTKNNSGTLKANGETSGTFVASPVSTEAVGAFASTVVDGNDADPALSAGTFAYNNQKPVGFKVTDELSGVSNDFLMSAANDPESFKTIHYQQVSESGVFVDGVRTVKTATAIRQGKFDIYSGKFDAGFPVVTEDAFSGADGASGDTAAKVTRQEPGTLVYKLGQPIPVSQEYDEKTG